MRGEPRICVVVWGCGAEVHIVNDPHLRELKVLCNEPPDVDRISARNFAHEVAPGITILPPFRVHQAVRADPRADERHHIGSRLVGDPAHQINGAGNDILLYFLPAGVNERYLFVFRINDDHRVTVAGPKEQELVRASDDRCVARQELFCEASFTHGDDLVGAWLHQDDAVSALAPNAALADDPCDVGVGFSGLLFQARQGVASTQGGKGSLHYHLHRQSGKSLAEMPIASFQRTHLHNFNNHEKG